MTTYPDLSAWRQAFQADPEECLDRLLRQADAISPLERARPADMALRGLSGGVAPDLAERALCAWIEARLADDDAAVTRRGANAYFTYAAEGLALAAWRPMPAIGALLRRRHGDLICWARLRSVGEGSGDLEVALAIALAHNQADASLRPYWLEMCDAAGGRARPDLADLWFGIALQGLRGVVRPDGAPVPIDDLTEALARWACHLTNTDADKARFDLQWRALQSAHPHKETEWQQAARRALGRHALRPFDGWWRQDLTLDAAVRAQRTPKGRTKQILDALYNVRDEAAAEAVVAPFYREHLAYAQASGDWGDYPKALDEVAQRLFEKGFARLAGRLARLIVEHCPREGQSWVLLAEALAEQGLTEAAEGVLWESIRLLPRNAHTYNTLAKLLKQNGNLTEAQALYRQVLDTNPNECYSLLGLGLLLVQMRALDGVPRLKADLERLGERGAAVTLHTHYRAAKGEIPPKAPEPEVPRPDVEAGPEWDAEVAVGKAMRARFLLSGALDRRDLIVANDNVRDELKAKARDLLAEAVLRAPHHPVVAMIARKYGGHSPGPVDDAELMAGRDFGRRLELARQARRAHALDWLAEDFTDVPARVMIALARLELEGLDEGPALEVSRWLANEPSATDAPILAYAHAELSKRLPARARGDVDVFLDAWDEGVTAEALSDLLDILQLGYVLASLPLLLDEPMAELALAA